MDEITLNRLEVLEKKIDGISLYLRDEAVLLRQRINKLTAESERLRRCLADEQAERIQERLSWRRNYNENIPLKD